MSKLCNHIDDQLPQITSALILLSDLVWLQITTEPLVHLVAMFLQFFIVHRTVIV